MTDPLTDFQVPSMTTTTSSTTTLRRSTSNQMEYIATVSPIRLQRPRFTRQSSMGDIDRVLASAASTTPPLTPNNNHNSNNNNNSSLHGSMHGSMHSHRQRRMGRRASTGGATFSSTTFGIGADSLLDTAVASTKATTTKTTERDSLNAATIHSPYYSSRSHYPTNDDGTAEPSFLQAIRCGTLNKAAMEEKVTRSLALVQEYQEKQHDDKIEKLREQFSNKKNKPVKPKPKRMMRRSSLSSYHSEVSCVATTADQLESEQQTAPPPPPPMSPAPAVPESPQQQPPSCPTTPLTVTSTLTNNNNNSSPARRLRANSTTTADDATIHTTTTSEFSIDLLAENHSTTASIVSGTAPPPESASASVSRRTARSEPSFNMSSQTLPMMNGLMMNHNNHHHQHPPGAAAAAKQQIGGASGQQRPLEIVAASSKQQASKAASMQPQYHHHHASLSSASAAVTDQIVESLVWFSFHTPRTVLEDLISHELRLWKEASAAKRLQTRKQRFQQHWQSQQQQQAQGQSQPMTVLEQALANGRKQSKQQSKAAAAAAGEGGTDPNGTKWMGGGGCNKSVESYKLSYLRRDEDEDDEEDEEDDEDMTSDGDTLSHGNSTLSSLSEDGNRTIKTAGPNTDVFHGDFSESMMRMQGAANKQKMVKLPHSVKRASALLFVDMSGFTKLSTLLDVESLSKVINSYFDMIVSEVLQHGGDILKFAGDAFFAEWRVLEDAHPDDVSLASSKRGTMNGRKSNPLADLNASLASFHDMARDQHVDSNNIPKLSTCVLSAARCAAAIVRSFSDYQVTSASNANEAMLNVHCGVGVGDLVGLHVGDFKEDQEEDGVELRREFLILGSPIDQVRKE